MNSPDDPASPVPPAYGKPGPQGVFDGDWFTEETGSGSTRFGVKVARRLYEEQSEFQKISVYESPFYGRFLTLDDLMMLTERDEFVYHEMLIHVPLCSVKNPRRVLVVGGGDLGCVREALKHPSVEEVVLCEIDERVTRVSEEWFPWVTPTLADPRVELVFDDGVKFLEANEGRFDLIVVDSTDPVGPAVGLFLRDFYGKVARALSPGGVLTAQSESPHWDPALVGAIYSEIRTVFPAVRSYLGAIPTYPSGCWSWAYASLETDPVRDFDRARAEAVEASCHYYNADLHQAAFVLPTFARRAVSGEGGGRAPGADRRRS